MQMITRKGNQPINGRVQMFVNGGIVASSLTGHSFAPRYALGGASVIAVALVAAGTVNVALHPGQSTCLPAKASSPCTRWPQVGQVRLSMEDSLRRTGEPSLVSGRVVNRVAGAATRLLAELGSP